MSGILSGGPNLRVGWFETCRPPQSEYGLGRTEEPGYAGPTRERPHRTAIADGSERPSQHVPFRKKATATTPSPMIIMAMSSCTLTLVIIPPMNVCQLPSGFRLGKTKKC